jgi:hypothetical protein
MTACVALLVLAICCWTPFTGVARADGDPASDVLLTEDVFYPYSSSVSKGLAEKLNGQTAAARAAGLHAKVALIGSESDLGADPVLFDKPQMYAKFLEQETIELAPYQLLLVVMPNGYGVSGSAADGAVQGAIGGLPKPAGATADDLARAATVALPRLASAAGHPLGSVHDVSSTSTSAGGSKPPAIAILALGAILIAGVIIIVRNRRRPRA